MHAQDETFSLKECEASKHVDHEDWYELLLDNAIEFLCVLLSMVMEGSLMNNLYDFKNHECYNQKKSAKNQLEIKMLT